MKVAIVHDWLVSFRGGEKVLQEICKMYPNAPIYTLFYDKTAMPPFFKNKEVNFPKFLNKFRLIRKLLLPFLPAAIESFRLESYDLIISTSSCVAKGVIPGPNTKHICYIHSPMRYLWDQRYQYAKRMRKIPGANMIFELFAARLRLWDTLSSSRVDHFLANSNFVKSRVYRYYGRQASVLHPPVDINDFKIKSKSCTKDYFLVLGAFVSYKSFDLAIKACQRSGKKLVVAGHGPEEQYLRKISTETTNFTINPDKQSLHKLLSGAKALIFPGVEDFGIVAIESLASGTPIIALNRGGACDFIRERENGLFFSEPTVKSLEEALETFNHLEFDPEKVAETAQSFSIQTFHTGLQRELKKLMNTEPL